MPGRRRVRRIRLEADPYDDAAVLANRTPAARTCGQPCSSPDSTSGRLKTTASVNYLRTKEFNIAFFGIAGATRRAGQGADQEALRTLQERQQGEEGAAADRFFISEPKLKDRGTDLLRKAPRRSRRRCSTSS